MSMLLLFLVAAAVSCIAATSQREEAYALLIDAGSTGSRSYVFRIVEEYKECSNTDNKCLQIDGMSKGGELTSREVEAFPGLRIKKGISSFADSPEDHLVADHFAPMFVDAAQRIPRSSWAMTHVFIKGTAGMRLLSQEKQEKLWGNLLLINKDKRNPFHLERDHLGTIDGDDEAYYAVLASNYIAKSIDGRLQRVSGTEMVGALDMGGSSTQLIFFVGDGSSGSSGGSDSGSNSREGKGETVVVAQGDFWSNSWLNYGAERVRERAQDLLIHRYLSTLSLLQREEWEGTSVQQGAEEGERGGGGHVSLPNPCFQQGYSAVVTHQAEYTVGGHTRRAGSFHLHGQGDPDQCMLLITDVLWPEQSCHRLHSGSGSGDAKKAEKATEIETGPCYLDGVRNPSLSGHFYAMSVYFFAYDAVKVLGEPANLEHWPTPTINELENAARAFCQLDWPGEPGARTSAWSKMHQYSGNSQLPNRCFETLYQAALLEHGFGFGKGDRHVTFAMDVEGKEVEWTLGFVLANLNLASLQEEEENSSSTFGGDKSLAKQLRVLSHQLHIVASIPSMISRYVERVLDMAHGATGGVFKAEL